MKLGNKFRLLILSLSLISFTGGCWNYRDISLLGIVAGAGIDLAPEPGKVLLTLQVIKPSGVKGGGGGGISGGEGGTRGGPSQSVVVFDSVGSTIFDALRNAVSQYNRKLYWAHNQIYIIGKEAAAQGVRRYIDLFIRDAEPRLTAWVLVAPGKAGDLIRAPGKMEKIPALEIADQVRAQSATSQASGFTIHDFANRLLSKTSAPLATEIRLDREKGFILGGTAVFKGDKLADFIEKKETRGLLWVIDKVKSGVVVVKAPGNNAKVSLELIRSRSNIKAEVKGDDLLIKVKVKVQSNLASQTGELNLSSNTLKSLARREAAAIKNEINAALQKAKALKLDIFGFGEAINRSDPKAWKRLEPRWEQIFPGLKVDLIVEVNISRVGFLIKPVSPE